MLKETLKKDEIAAMKARDKARVSVLRLVNSEIKSFEVNNREDISDENVIKIVEKSIKQNKEALEYAIKANDEDKIAEGKFAIEVLTPYLPKQLTEEELTQKMQEIITELCATSIKDIGAVMKKAKETIGAAANGKAINEVAKKILNNC